MTKADEWSALKKEIAKAQRERGPRNRFDEGLRTRILKVAHEQLARGETAMAESQALGLGRRTLEGWLPRASGRKTQLPVVEVVLAERAPARSFVLELGGGRIAGLELEDVAELIRRLR